MIQPKNRFLEKPTAAPHIDYRTLVRRSRYEQIETELTKLKGRLATLEGQSQTKIAPLTKLITEEKSHKQQTEVSSARLNQALVNIEDDLHRILYILLHQYEVNHRRQHRHTKNSNVLALKPTESKNSNTAETQKEHSKLCKESRTISQPNLFSQTSELIAQQEHTATKYRPQTNERSKSSPRKSNEAQILHCHYHITKPDVHWMLGTSPNPSFSMMARKQLQLANLKQHGPLCMKSTPNLAIEYDLEDRAQMISRIQKMINKLQFEYDRWYRKLQFQQSVDHSGEDSVEVSRLSSHLIHIMDQLVELHQLNKSFLC